MVFFLPFLLACGTTYRIDNKFIKLNPYEEGDILIFKSSEGELDTVTVTEVVRQRTSTAYGVDLNADYIEGLSVVVNHSIPSIEPIYETQKGSIFMIHNYGEGATIDFWFAGIDKRDSYSRSVKAIELLNLEKTSLVTRIGNFKDVVIIETDTIYTSQYHDRISKVFWSIEQGYLKLEIDDSKEWLLVQKINANKR